MPTDTLRPPSGAPSIGAVSSAQSSSENPSSARAERLQWNDEDKRLNVGRASFALTVDPTTWNVWMSTPDLFVLEKSRHYLDNLVRFAPRRVENTARIPMT